MKKAPKGTLLRNTHSCGIKKVVQPASKVQFRSSTHEREKLLQVVVFFYVKPVPIDISAKTHRRESVISTRALHLKQQNVREFRHFII
jgi:hypothetical protein